jgi:tetratricopeptide (TPR) repeat protein
MSGTAHDVVQARDIRGGVHFHGTGRFGVPFAATQTAPRQLPGTVPLFVGRRPELDRLRALVADGRDEAYETPRMAVIVGTAGAGKTSLALRFAHEIRNRYPDGQLFIDLRGYSAQDPVPPAAALDRFLRAMGVPAADIPRGVDERAEYFRSLSADRALLVVLDNVATAGQARPLLPGVGGSLVIVTSRGRLPALSRFVGAARIDLGLLDAEESANLLSSAMREYRSADAPATVAELATICAGLPLALRIAAERAITRPLTPLAVLIADLRREALLWGVLSTEDEVSEAAESVFAWSYRRLPGTAARAFRLLGLHPGADFGPDSAAAVAGEPAERIRELLDVLVGAHLLEQRSPARFRFHDLLKAFAAHTAEREDTSADREAAMRRLADYYVYATLAASGRLAELPTGGHAERLALPDAAQRFADREQALAWYEAERDNILAVVLAAAAWGFDDVCWLLPVLAAPLYSAGWDTTLRLEAATAGLEAALRLADPAAEAAVRLSLGAAHKAAGDYARALDQNSAARALLRTLGDRAGFTQACNRVAVSHLMMRNFPAVVAALQEGLDATDPEEPDAMRLTMLGNLAECYLDMGEPAKALAIAEALPPANRSAYEEQNQAADENAVRLVATYTEVGAFDRAEEYADVHGAHLTGNLRHRMLLAHAELRIRQGRLEDALADYESCVALQSAEKVRVEADAFDGKGRVLRLLGRAEEASAFHLDALEARRRAGEPFETAKTLVLLGAAYRELSRLAEAAQATDEALSLLAPFDDRKANDLRRKLEEWSSPEA